MTYEPDDDLYARLGVPHDAPVAVIKSAYRVLILKVHPDVHGDRGHAATLLLNEAWAVLGDEGKRAEYDSLRKQHHGRAAPSPSPEPRAGSRRGSQGRRAGQARAKEPPPNERPDDFDWYQHIHPHPTKPGYYQIDEELIAKAVEGLFTLVGEWLNRRRAQAAAPH